MTLTAIRVIKGYWVSVAMFLFGLETLSHYQQRMGLAEGKSPDPRLRRFIEKFLVWRPKRAVQSDSLQVGLSADITFRCPITSLKTGRVCSESRLSVQICVTAR
jgi:hypothetical protein